MYFNVRLDHFNGANTAKPLKPISALAMVIRSKLAWKECLEVHLSSIANPRDFCFIEELLCDWCLNSRMAATGYDSCPTMNEELLGDDSASFSCSTLAASSSSSTNNASPQASTISTNSRNLNKCSAANFQSSSTLNDESSDRSSLSAASLQFMMESAASNNNNNSGPQQQHFLGIQSSMAFLASLFNHGATEYPQTYLPTLPSAFSSLLQKTNQPSALQSPSIIPAGFPKIMASSKPNLSTAVSPTFPFSLPPHFNTQTSLDIQQQQQQQLAMTWHSQLLALSFLNSMQQQQQQNGFIFPPHFPLNSVIQPSNFDQQQQQLLSSASSDDEAFSLLFGQRLQQRKYSSPTSNQTFFSTGSIEGSNKSDIPSQKIGDEQPLDLSAKPSALKNAIGKTSCPSRLKMNISDDVCSPHLIKGILSQQIRDSHDLDEEIDLNDNGNTNSSVVNSNSNLLEDGSEAETPKLLGVKKYSQADLDAAVLDIRLGRLGTRRASVVYGIPRSTLRNKIYKLEAADELLTSGLDCSTNNNSSRHRRLAASALNKKERKRVASTSVSSSPRLKKEKQQEADEGIDLNNRSNVEKNYAMIHKKGENLKAKENDSGEHLETSLAVKQQQQQQLDVLIPSASTSLTVNGTSVPAITAETLFKELTSQLGQFVGQANNIEQLANCIPTEPQCDFDLEKYQEFDPKCKGKRQKRGQYRKYNKDALDRAVTAVRNGEMSVHRAGSHFGVPHSTLEYKVKERNLMRIKSKKQHGLLRLPPILTASSDASGGVQLQHQQNSLHSLQNNNNSNGEGHKNAEEGEEESCSPVTGEVQNLLGTMLKSLVSAASANNRGNNLC
uniref:HTH psq-type domain-containing protein n=1 Tax=Meloidogyne incognita TaxID=6306 RepID=A0A914KXS0_MELIC